MSKLTDILTAFIAADQTRSFDDLMARMKGDPDPSFGEWRSQALTYLSQEIQGLPGSTTIIEIINAGGSLLLLQERLRIIQADAEGLSADRTDARWCSLCGKLRRVEDTDETARLEYHGERVYHVTYLSCGHTTETSKSWQVYNKDPYAGGAWV